MPTQLATTAPVKTKPIAGLKEIIIALSAVQYGALAALGDADRCSVGLMARKIIGDHLAQQVRS